MRRDHRPYFIKALQRRIESSYIEHFLRPQLDRLGGHPLFMKPWYVRIHGKGIELGEQIHIVAAKDRNVQFCTWQHEQHQGAIRIGDYSLVCPGVRIDSASRVDVGSNCMLAAGAYLSDADWHDIYDRTRPIGTTKPIALEDNVWIGDGAIVCKGVTIGANSIVGAGAVVASDVPANVIVAGNPARIVRELDPSGPHRRREDLLAGYDELHSTIERLERYLLRSNSLLGWVRSLVNPRQDD